MDKRTRVRVRGPIVPVSLIVRYIIKCDLRGSYIIYLMLWVSMV